jgi:predicted RNase H-like HicB family nuclease
MFRYILTGYVESALSQAEYDKVEDGTYSGCIPPCKGVIAFGKTLRECEDELRSTLEDWALVGLKLGHADDKMDVGRHLVISGCDSITPQESIKS